MTNVYPKCTVINCTWDHFYNSGDGIIEERISSKLKLIILKKLSQGITGGGVCHCLLEWVKGNSGYQHTKTTSPRNMNVTLVSRLDYHLQLKVQVVIIFLRINQQPCNKGCYENMSATKHLRGRKNLFFISPLNWNLVVFIIKYESEIINLYYTYFFSSSFATVQWFLIVL